MDEGGAVQESGDLFRLVRETVEPLVVGGALLSPVLGDEIGQPRARDGRLEHISLRDRPFGHVSAVRPAADAEPLGVGYPAIDQVFHPSDYVLVIAAAPIAAIHLNESLAIAARSANIRIKNRVAARRKKLPPRFDGVLPGARGAAVNQCDKRQLRLAVVAERLQ